MRLTRRADLQDLRCSAFTGFRFPPEVIRVEADHAQLKRWLRPMHGIKTITGLRILAAGHAFVQSLRRGTTSSPPTNPAADSSPLRSPNWPKPSDCQPGPPAR
jgi:hypothetical protein